MHSAWNSWPQGKLITLLCPSTYSSRHTTHSTCRPVYFRRHRVDPDLPFLDDDILDALAFETCDSRCDRDSWAPERLFAPNNGEVGDTGPGLTDRGELVSEEEVDLAIV